MSEVECLTSPVCPKRFFESFLNMKNVTVIYKNMNLAAQWLSGQRSCLTARRPGSGFSQCVHEFPVGAPVFPVNQKHAQ